MQIFNNLTSIKSDKFNNPERSRFYKRYIYPLAVTAVVSGAAVIFTSYTLGRLPFFLLSFMSILGLSYDIKIFPGKKYKKIRQLIGLVPQDIALYETLSARENLQFIAEMYGLKGKEARQRIEECLEVVGLASNGHKQIRKYSGGMKRRINLVAGILHRPEILILDEPTTGVDVQSRTVILEYLAELNKQGTTIIYTSHYLEEAENLCDTIAIIDHGKLIIRGDTAEIIESKKEYVDLESVFLHLTGHKLRD